MHAGFALSFLVTIGLILSGSLSPVTQDGSGVSSEEKEAVLAAHNNARRNDVPGNTGDAVPALEWDDALAGAAQAYAKTIAKTSCTNGAHDPNNKDGENLYQSWTTDLQEPPKGGANAVADWLTEKANYTYDNNTCKPGTMCGHYTQLVWRDTKKVGCGSATCTADNALYTHWVCRYSPAGNVNIETTKPY